MFKREDSTYQRNKEYVGERSISITEMFSGGRDNTREITVNNWAH